MNARSHQKNLKHQHPAGSVHKPAQIACRQLGKGLTYLIAISVLQACQQHIAQTATIVIAPSIRPTAAASLSTPIPVTSKAPGLNPSVQIYCTQGEAALAGDQGQALKLARQYRQNLNSLLSLLPAPAPSPSVSPTSTPQPSLASTPTPIQTSDISVINHTTLNGKVFNRNNQTLDAVTVRARSLNSAIAFDATTTTTGGIYTFNNVPAGIAIEITASLAGYTTRRRVEVLKSNKDGDPGANRYDFGNDGSETTYGPSYNALSDLPEIIASLPGRDAVKVDTLTEIRLTFSEPMDRDSVEQNLVIKKLVPSGNPEKVFDTSAFFVSWNADETEIRLKLAGSYEFAKDTNYRVTFSPNVMIKDKSGAGRNSEYFRLSDGFGENELRFGTISAYQTAGLAWHPPKVSAFESAIFPALAFQSPAFTTLQISSQAARKSLEPVFDDISSSQGLEWTRQALQTNKIPDSAWAGQGLLPFESFDHVGQQSIPGGLFKVSLGLWKHEQVSPGQQSVFEVGTHLSAPFQCAAGTSPLNLTLVVNTAASMLEPATSDGPQPGEVLSKFALLKSGLAQLPNGLKPGDTINLVTFAEQAVVRLTYKVGVDQPQTYQQALEQLKAGGNADIQAGLSAAYRLAQAQFEPGKLNRVLLLSESRPEDGNIDLTQIKTLAGLNNQTGIPLSILVLGELRNPTFIQQLSDAGRGVSYVIQTATDMREAMQDRLLPLIHPLFRNLRIKLEYPGWLNHFAVANEYQPVSALQTPSFTGNRSHYLLTRFAAEPSLYKPTDTIRLTLQYQDPILAEEHSEVFEKALDQMLDQDLRNIKAAHMIELTTSLIRKEVTVEQVQSELKGLLQDVGQ